MGVQDSREAEQDSSNPDTDANPTCPEGPSLPPLGQRSGEGQVSVHAHKQAAVDIHLNAQVDEFAKELTKGPVETVGYVDSPEWQTGHQDEVGSSQVAQVDLGYGAGLLVETEYHQDKHIKHNSQHRDEQDIHWLTGVEPLPVILLRTPSAIGVVLVSI
uniref:Uncharacterized protein n=1 Tax=Seriola lalandi dorsalis TaxID=1841481 RepID=A0A3B4WZN5_SERLL